MNYHLESSGLSMSQAQSISNLCNQKALVIQGKIDKVNNFSSTLKIEGETYVQQAANKLPDNILELLQEKAQLHFLQAFLKENIDAKEAKLNAQKKLVIVYPELPPEAPTLNKYNSVIHNLNEVGESFGWDQLTSSELIEFWQAEAYAAHLGKFIHADGKLSKLRKEVNLIPGLTFFEIQEGIKTPVTNVIHHTDDELLELHEKIANEHKDYERKVNYFKAKVKNLVTEENARRKRKEAEVLQEINVKNEILNQEFSTQVLEWNNKRSVYIAKAAEERELEIKRIAALRIAIPASLKELVDTLMKGLTEEK